MKKNNFFTYAITANDSVLSHELKAKLLLTLVSLKAEEDLNEPEYLFVIGGDGTFVHAIKDYYFKETKVICINAGTVGFYAGVKPGDISSISNFLKESNFIKPNILKITHSNREMYAINEVVFQSLSTIIADIKIDDILYEKFQGSGLLISTITGSTAYTKSVGGAIIMPNVNAYQLVEIAPVDHAKMPTITSPVILNDNSIITLENIYSNQKLFMVIDGVPDKNEFENMPVKIELIKSKMKIIFSKNLNEYIEKLRNTFINHDKN